MKRPTAAIRTLHLLIAFMVLGAMALSIPGSAQNRVVHVYGQASNDLYEVLQHQAGLTVQLYDSPMEAVQQAADGAAVLVLADGYPEEPVGLTDDFFEQVRAKQLRVYVEYPSYIPGIDLGPPEASDLKRAVVSSGFFEERLDSLQILGINGLHYLPVRASNPHIVAARVAGFDHAMYGLPDDSSPLLFEWPGQSVLVSTTNLSRFVTGRYAPRAAWAGVWEAILRYLLPGEENLALSWEPVITPWYGKDEPLPEGYQRESIRRGIEWYTNAKMLVPASYEDTLQAMVERDEFRLKWHASMPVGDGRNGVFEAIMSEIDENGNQPIGIVKRGDCISETAMTFALAGTVLDREGYLETARNLLDFYLIHSPATKNEYGDSTHGAYGLIPWGISNEAWYKASYGDDNARLLMSALVTSALTGTDRWDEPLMKSLVALARTTGSQGFRGNRIDLEHFEENGWRHYYSRDVINVAPHYEAYLWAAMLWAYHQTSDPLFLDRTESAIKQTMAQYPGGWKWTNGLAQEKARMLLPLTWLVRIRDTPENRAMLYTVVDGLLALQTEEGAIREEFGAIENGRYPPPQSNDAYGTGEASLIAENGDPVADLLYTTNFAFVGLHEAAYATGDPRIRAAADKLAEFLARVQVDSEEHPEVHGAWMRAFDFERHEHWGSNADHGWGAWAIESGWTQGWITSIMALRELDTSIWDLINDSDADRYFEDLRARMIPE